ncbi:TetR/AcrR family transcriptional regulator C-terminal domain-containing protein [Glutamicibacter sp. NPDC087344]|uniref:TetR/AcrR family transcriptional regulator C-terminal domain-containing protein n=1 Tax=Glutamicibacter sp. NPDC087344 TaxID=3363994 RepID=UPI0038133FE5
MARPTKPKLSTEAIAVAALSLVDAQGEFTLPQLAKTLNVTPSSLYNHVSGKDEIIELMRGRAMAAISLPSGETEDWQATVRQIAISYWQSYSQHPRLIPLLTSHTVRDRTTLRVYDALAEAFARAGFPPADRLHAITIIDSFVLGSAMDAAAPKVVWEADESSGAEFTEALAAGLDVEQRARRSFEMGLELILKGLAQTRR